MQNTIVYNFFPFETNLAEKWSYKHKGKIMKYTTIFNWLILQFVTRFETGSIGTTSETAFIAPYHGYIHILSKHSDKINRG